MSYRSFNPPVAPSPGTQVGNQIGLYKTAFGDGYAQRSPKGLNHVRRQVSVKWDALTLDQAQAIETFLREHGGYVPFFYTVRGDAAPSKWTCETWTRTDGAPATFTATFEEFFGEGLKAPVTGAVVVTTTQTEFEGYKPKLGETVVLLDA